MRPYTYICSASAQKAELNVEGWGVLELRTGWGRGKCASLYTGSAFEMYWWKFGVFKYILQYYRHFSPRLHALHVLIWYTLRN